MTLTVTTVLTRLTLETSYQLLPADIIQYIKTTYQDTGKILSLSVELSEDKLSRTSTVVFADDAARKLYIADPILKEVFVAQRAYNAANGMVQERLFVNA